MNKVIDEKVVSMQFDNKRFEQGVATTMSTLDKLKQKLNFSGATKGFEEIDAASKKVNMSALGDGIEAVRAKFSALQVMGITTLTNLTNQAVNSAKRMVSALTIDPIKAGFQEYETQIGSVQTILANTESKGSTLQDVNRALDELNTYADKTIYNFTEMTRNIGTFTAAGVDLDTSVSAIQGIANLAAVSGSTSQQASTAMYQLSQALSSGTVRLMDWNSVVNAGMGGQVFQDALKRTSEMLGTGAEKAIKLKGSFRESLQTGWLTADVLTKTLEQFTMAAEEGSEQWEMYKKSLMDDGYTEEQALSILKMANTATDAATKVKTFTQLWDTLKESAQSGWTQTWEIMIGDFEEAKEFLTGISDTIGPMISAAADARNKLLSSAFSSGWKQLLGAGISNEEDYKDEITKLARENGDAFDKLIEETAADGGSFQDALKKGLESGLVTSDTLSKSVSNLTDKISGMSAEEREAAGYTVEQVTALKELNEGLKKGTISMDEYVEKMKALSGREKVIMALKNAFDGVMNVVKPIGEAFGEVFKPLTSADITSAIDNLVKLSEKFKEMTSKYAPQIKSTFKGIFSIFDMLRKVVVAVGNAFLGLSKSEGITSLGDFILNTFAKLGDFFTSLNEGFKTDGLTGILTNVASGISGLLKGAVGGLEGLGEVLSSVGNWIVKVAKMIWEPIKKTFTWITENVSIGDIFAGLAGGGIFMAAKKLTGLFDKIKETIDNLFAKKGLKENFVEVLDTVKGSLESFTQGIKVWSLVGIAAAVGILANALRTISGLKAVDIGKSLLAIAAMLKMLTVSFESMTKTLTGFESKGIVKSSFALILVAKAVDILADVMVKLSGLSFPEICKGLIGVGGALLELSLAAKIIDKTKISVSTGISIILLAEACKILGDALKKFGGLSWEEIGHGLVGMGGALLELAIVMKLMKKAGGVKSVLSSAALLILVQSLSTLADGLKKFGSMSWTEIGKGLTGMGTALLELAVVMRIMKKAGGIGGKKSLLSSASIFITIQGLNTLAEALKKFGSMSWSEIGRGLSAMGGALAEVGIITSAVGKFAGLSSLFGAASILITIQGLDDLANALKKFGSMSWSEIGRGLVAMGGALLEVGVISGALGYLAGFAGLLGSATLLATISGLDALASAFSRFGEMSWDEIKRGLVGMGGALAEVGIISGALGWLTGFAGIIGSGSLLMTISGLGDLADAFKKFGEMEWDEIERGLAAMGGALGEVALGGFLNTLSGLGAASISAMAEPLGTLADSVKKWTGVTVPEDLGVQLGKLSDGIFSFTLDGAGASAIAEVAAPLGVMADSVKKWTGVTVPEGLGTQLDILASAVNEFLFGGFGASALAEAAGPLGIMADSVKKWDVISLVNAPMLGIGLSAIAEGIKGFSWLFMAGWSMSTLVEPLGALPESIQKWNGVAIPEDLATGLTSLAEGIKSFSWLFLAGWSLSAITGPLGELVDDVLKWKDVKIPESISDDLSGLADAIKDFSWAFLGGWSIDAITGPLSDLADSVKKWSGVKIPDKLGTGLSSLATGVKAFSGITNISTGINGMKSISDSATKLTNIPYKSISSGLSQVAKGLTNLGSVDFSKLDSLDSAAAMLDELADSMKGVSSEFESVGNTITTSISSGISSAAHMLTTSSKVLMTSFTTGITSYRPKILAAFKGLATSSVSVLNAYSPKFSLAGANAVRGFASGISAYTFLAEARSRAMALAALRAAKKALDEHSPSKEFYKVGAFGGKGFVNSFNDYESKAYTAGYDMAISAKDGLTKATDYISRVFGDEMGNQPTITPVVDLSEVRASTKDILSMLDLNSSVGIVPNVKAISTMMNRRNQNGTNDDVVDAIGKLRKDLGNVNNTTYSINGITYNSDSDVGEAIETLVRAIRIEGRV